MGVDEAMIKKLGELEGFFYISDVHIDTHTDTVSPKKMERTVKNLLFETEQEAFTGKVLLIAGDIGHYPKQNAVFLKACETFFETVLCVFGNHEMYLLPGSMKERYSDSFKKIEAMKDEIYSVCSKTEVLDGKSVFIDDVSVFGTPMWYDFSFLTKKGYGEEYALHIWKAVMNDARMIEGRNGRFDPLEYFDEQMRKLASKEAFSADVILTHVPPIPLGNRLYGNSDYEAFYCFDGKEFLKNCKARYWICGHNHEPRLNGVEVYGTKVVLNPAGYGFA